MSDEPVESDLQNFQQQIEVLKRTVAHATDSAAALEELQLVYEELLTTLEASGVLEEGLIQQNQRISAAYQYYAQLFQAAPVPYLVTDADGVILEANQAIAQLLNRSQSMLIGQPLLTYLPTEEQEAFRRHWSQLAGSSRQIWQVTFCPQNQPSLRVELHIESPSSLTQTIEYLRIGVYALDQAPTVVLSPEVNPQELLSKKPMISPLPQSLDGLQVLVVDDEADVREFITAILEHYNVSVRTVASAAAALEALEQFQPDVLVSDIRLPGIDGYRLIQQIRALEARDGRHLPAAAITAYLDEDRDKALQAGFEAYVHKLAQPDELVEVIARLARRSGDDVRT